MIKFTELDFDDSEYKSESDKLSYMLNVFALGIYHGVEQLEGIKNQFKSCFSDLFHRSKQDSFFWTYCPSQVYVTQFNDRLDHFLYKEPEKCELDFIENEIVEINSSFCDEKEFEQPDGDLFKYGDKELRHYIQVTEKFGNNFGFIPDFIKLDFLDDEMVRRVIATQYKKLEYLRSRLSVANSKNQSTNPHPSIFQSRQTFELFESLLERIGKSHSDISFIYRSLVEDNFIHQKSVSEFSNWLEKYYSIGFKARLQQKSHVDTYHRKDIYHHSLVHQNLESRTKPEK